MKNIKIAVIGLGYVGLPLAKEFAKIFKVIAYDTNVEKIKPSPSGKPQIIVRAY